MVTFKKQFRIPSLNGTLSRGKKFFADFNQPEMILLIIGIVLWTIRFVHYLPVYHAESARILTIQQHSLWDLIRLPGLGNFVHDPKGFLALSKIFSLFLPNHELSFRFPVFLCSLLGYVFFFRLSRALLAPAGRCVAMGLYIICPFLVEHSSRMLPYACDIFISNLFLIIFFQTMVSDLRSIRVRLFYAAAGGLAAVSSLPAIFILTGCGLVLVIQILVRREADKMKKFFPLVFFWIVIWAVHYFYSVHHFTQWNALLHEWERHLWPVTAGWGPRISWFFLKFVTMFQNPLGLVGWLSLPLWCLGIMAFWARDRFKLFLIISPLCMLLIAVLLRKYPFHGRVLAFTIPLNLILIGRGGQFIYNATYKKLQFHWLAVLACCLLFIHPLKELQRDLRYSHINGGVPSALKWIRANWLKGDGIYVHRTFRDDFIFLNQRYGFSPQEYVLGVCLNSDECIAEMNDLPAFRRIWLILRNDRKKGAGMIRFHIDHQATQVQSRWGGGCFTYLYEMNSHDKLPKPKDSDGI